MAATCDATNVDGLSSASLLGCNGSGGSWSVGNITQPTSWGFCSARPSPCSSSNFEIGPSILNCVSLQAVHLMVRSFSVDLPYFLRARVLRLYYALNHSCDPSPDFTDTSIKRTMMKSEGSKGPVTRRRYTEDFKQAAVRLVRDSARQRRRWSGS